MPRTKVSKNPKRNREQAQDDALLNYLREYDEYVEAEFAALENKHTENIQRIERETQEILSLISEEILNMKIGDIKAMTASNLAEVFQLLQVNVAETLSSTREANSVRKRKQSKEDEEGRTSENTTTVAPTSAIRGPLSAARAKMRRSKSTGMIPSVPRMPPSRLKPPTPLKGPLVPQTEHKSRSAYRTPLTAPQRIKSSSADRIDKIMPKMPIDESLALLRYPRVGETLVSLTGSPVVGFSGSMEPTASVNIPTNDGVLSLRPTASSNFDAQMISQIDPETYQNLQQLQKNLAMIVEMGKKSIAAKK
uniref:Borealin C-terminal domain-containing protein n=1 Tax=Lutzomyia longipalpis TaxID=7200 RepID=A0A1B0GHF1_LUTLO